MEGGTRLDFVTDGLESALNQAREAAKGEDVRIGGGVSVIRRYLAAGQIDIWRFRRCWAKGSRYFPDSIFPKLASRRSGRFVGNLRRTYSSSGRNYGARGGVLFLESTRHGRTRRQ